MCRACARDRAARRLAVAAPRPRRRSPRARHRAILRHPLAERPMRASLRSLAVPLCLALVAACAAGDGADADSALARDLALAAQPGTPSATPDIVPADTALGAAPEPAAAAPVPAR